MISGPVSYTHLDVYKRQDRSPEDLLFQVLLDWGVDLALPIGQQTIAGKTVFFVDGNALAACFETGIDEDFVKQLAAYKPLRVVFRDAGFVSDSVKINVEQVFKLSLIHISIQAGPGNHQPAGTGRPGGNRGFRHRTESRCAG